MSQSDENPEIAGGTDGTTIGNRSDSLKVNLNKADGTEIGTSSNPVRTDPTGTTTQPISAASLPLPTGASTSALQTTGNTSLASIDGKLNSLGQKTMANSVPVVLSSDQSAIPVSQSGTWNLNNISGTISLPTGASTSALQTTGNTSLSSIDTKLSSQATAANQSTEITSLQLIDDLPISQGSSLGSNKGIMDMGSVTTADPTYTTGNINPLSLTTSGRLRVDSQASLNPVPLNNIVYKSTNVLNSGSKSMNVNGSVTPVNFDFTPSSGETWFLEAISFIVFQTTTPDITDFAAIAGPLTNGLDIRIRTQGTEYVFATLKDNMDIVNVFCDFGLIPPTSGGFMNETDLFFGTVTFQVPIKLSNSQSDYVRFRVQDNLSTVAQMRGLVKVWRTI